MKCVRVAKDHHDQKHCDEIEVGEFRSYKSNIVGRHTPGEAGETSTDCEGDHSLFEGINHEGSRKYLVLPDGKEHPAKYLVLPDGKEHPADS